MNKMYVKLGSIFSLALFSIMARAGSAYAALSLPTDSFNELAKSIINIAIGVIGAIFVILFIVGGVQYLTSAGNEEASTKAKKLLVDAVIGLVIVIVSWSASEWIFDYIGAGAGLRDTGNFLQ